MVNHIPGNPTMIVQNQPAAGGMILTNQLYNQGPKDGTVFSAPLNSIPTAPMLMNGTQFDATKLNWLGSLNREAYVAFLWHTAPVSHIADMATKEVLVGSTTVGTTMNDFPLLLNELLGYKFKLVRGYKGTPEINIAIERGEIQGNAGVGLASVKTLSQKWIDEKKIKFIGSSTAQPYPELAGVPMVMDQAKTDAQRQAMRLLFARTEFARPYFLPPDVPAERVQALRRAFDATMKDPAFLAEAEKLQLEISADDRRGAADAGRRTRRDPAGDRRAREGRARRAGSEVTVACQVTPVDTDNASLRARRAMYCGNALQIGLFGPNCSSGRAVTTVPERWTGSWAENLALARMADEAGIDFLLPIGRWKGYGGNTDYQGETLETINWASGLLASTKRITVFGTVHAPLFNPIIAAKKMVTADHIGAGRFGLNIVVGWNEGEFEMFGVEQREHEARYDYAQEWIDAIKLAWSDREDFDFDGRFLKLKGIRAKPKPYGGTRPVIMNAGASATGQAFAIRNCDAFFVRPSRVSIDETAQRVATVKKAAKDLGREIGVYTVGVITCKPTREGSAGLLPALERRSRRLDRGRRHPRDQEHHAADRADGGVQPQAPAIHRRHGRAFDRRRSRPGGEAARRSLVGGPDRHRGVGRELSRRASLLLRRRCCRACNVSACAWRRGPFER